MEADGGRRDPCWMFGLGDFQAGKVPGGAGEGQEMWSLTADDLRDGSVRHAGGR